MFLIRFVFLHEVFEAAAKKYAEDGLFRAGVHLFADLIWLIPTIRNCKSYADIARVLNVHLIDHCNKIIAEFFLFMKRTQMLEKMKDLRITQ